MNLTAAPVASADADRDKQWHLPYLKITQAHRITQGEGVIVAIIDSGVDAGHRDLTGSVLRGTVTVPGRDGDGRTDRDGHGTAMAALIAAHGHGSDDGVLGIAPGARILPIDVSQTAAKESMDLAAIAPAIDYAVAHKAKIINLSISGAASPDVREAVARAIAADVVVVAGAGNTPSFLVGYPAAYPGVLAVAAVDRKGNHAAISVTGQELVLAAPGVQIVTADTGGGYLRADGTSAATAIVSGAAALVRAKYPQLKATEVIHRLAATATDKGPKGRDEEYGYGVLNLVAALTADVQPEQAASAVPTLAPTPTAGSGGSGSFRPNRPMFASVGVIALGVLLLLLAVGGLTWALVRRRSSG